MQSLCKKIVVFDLDDTLYKEIDFLKSGYKSICEHYDLKGSVYENMLSWYYAGQDVFSALINNYNLNIDKTDLLKIYREHIPNIKLDVSVICTLSKLKSQNFVMGIITDGRTITQNNKISALGLSKFIDDENIIISEDFGSEKPSEKNYLYFQNKYPDYNYIYVGDNIQKDFLAPNILGWNTICLLDDGCNIHKQNFNKVAEKFLPKTTIKKLIEILKEIL